MQLVYSSSRPLREQLQGLISQHTVLLFMKGTPQQPRCGFSERAVRALQALDTDFVAVDVLEPTLRQALCGLSNWPTVPQLFVDGQLVGGCDTVCELAERGELAELPSSVPAVSGLLDIAPLA